ncbi:hypothetical protein Pmani_014047 [Petrolisthes manimaculis]|uniref:WAP domain-containing protein n=1 Tax=Petrolisthes manimaculis TaxID=1843537 RepID=A0AAE1PUX8_9EUCA|nr:hypothetical protein Pmani_014047 [Petrolisthes manimaculis]
MGALCGQPVSRRQWERQVSSHSSSHPILSLLRDGTHNDGNFGNYVCCDENPGNCPRPRIACPHHRIQALQPRFCNFDPECYGNEKCCYDVCLPNKVCKPSEYH